MHAGLGERSSGWRPAAAGASEHRCEARSALPSAAAGRGDEEVGHAQYAILLGTKRQSSLSSLVVARGVHTRTVSHLSGARHQRWVSTAFFSGPQSAPVACGSSPATWHINLPARAANSACLPPRAHRLIAIGLAAAAPLACPYLHAPQQPYTPDAGRVFGWPRRGGRSLSSLSKMEWEVHTGSGVLRQNSVWPRPVGVHPKMGVGVAVGVVGGQAPVCPGTRTQFLVGCTSTPEGVRAASAPACVGWGAGAQATTRAPAC